MRQPRMVHASRNSRSASQQLSHGAAAQLRTPADRNRRNSVVGATVARAAPATERWAVGRRRRKNETRFARKLALRLLDQPASSASPVIGGLSRERPARTLASPSSTCHHARRRNHQGPSAADRPASLVMVHARRLWLRPASNSSLHRTRTAALLCSKVSRSRRAVRAGEA